MQQLAEDLEGLAPGHFVSAPAGSLLTSLRLHATEDPWPTWEWPRPQPVLTPSLSGVGRSLPNVFLPTVLSRSPKGILLSVVDFLLLVNNASY